jgi:hypothetical protein
MPGVVVGAAPPCKIRHAYTVYILQGGGCCRRRPSPEQVIAPTIGLNAKLAPVEVVKSVRSATAAYERVMRWRYVTKGIHYT